MNTILTDDLRTNLLSIKQGSSYYRAFLQMLSDRLDNFYQTSHSFVITAMRLISDLRSGYVNEPLGDIFEGAEDEIYDWLFQLVPFITIEALPDKMADEAIRIMDKACTLSKLTIEETHDLPNTGMFTLMVAVNGWYAKELAS